MNKSKPVVVSGKFRDFVTDLNERAGIKGHMPFVGREDELEAVMETLLRKLKNNLLLVGKPGVGKTALITELARRINRGDVPPFLRGKIVLGLSVNAFVYSKDSLDPLINDFERFFSEMKQNRERIILFLDDMQMQTLVGTHKQRQFSHFEGLLKTHIADRELTVIAAASSEDYVRYIKSDEIFSSNFSTIVLSEPDKEEMLRILCGVRDYFESYYSLEIPVRLFEDIFVLSQRYVPHRAFPDKAIDLLDMSCSKASVKKEEKLGLPHLYQSVSSISRLPIEIVRKDPKAHYLGLLDHLRQSLVNQVNALEEISRIIKIAKLDTDADRVRPEMIFLFLGPTGSGKSFAAGEIAGYLFGTKEKLRMIDLGEMKKAEDVEKLVAGGNAEDPGMLVREAENHPFSLILLENIGEAHTAVLHFLGKILKNGLIVDRSGKIHYLTNIIFVLSLTSIGEIRRSGGSIGFEKGDASHPEIVIAPKIMGVLDWVDEIIQFVPLSREHLRQIAELTVKRLTDELKTRYNCTIEVDPQVLDWISLQAEASGRFAHAVTEFVDRKIRIRAMDLVPAGDDRISLAVRMEAGQIRVGSR